MKRISAMLLVAMLCGSAQASGGDDFTRSRSYPDPFTERGGPDGPALLPGTVRLTPAEIDSLILSRGAATHSFPSIDRFTGNELDPLVFRSAQLFSEGARIRVLRAGREVEQLRPARQYYFASNASTGIGLAVHPDTGAVTGFVVKDGDRLQIKGDVISQLEFEDIEQPDDLSFTCGNEDSDLLSDPSVLEADPALPSASAAQAGTLISYEAVVAIETDSEWLDGFGDNTSAAMNWISDLFLALNVFYERDIETRLLIGDVILRTGSDPYSVQSNRSAQLSEFGGYWMNNMQNVDRQFAAMLSGRNISGWAFSGIAWINAYCEYGQVFGSQVAGSYSYNAIGSSFSAAAAAHFVGHELGHNLGSQHTHCYSPPIDGCAAGGTYNGQACFSGTPACPADGTGTVMSYCHNLANCDAETEFHPTVQAKLENLLANELAAGCILPYTETNPEPEFESVPGSGATIQFGNVAVGQTSAPQSVQTQNTGTADLTLLCGLSGLGQGAFSIVNCPLLLSPAQSAPIQLTCGPGSATAQSATLTVLTSDLDEPIVQYSLSCTGVPLSEMIFLTGFEN